MNDYQNNYKTYLTDSNQPGIILCADDYGLNPSIGSAIRKLIEMGRLSATSCLTTTRHWKDQGTFLRPFLDRLDIGLHLSLTDTQPIGHIPHLAPNSHFPKYSQLLKKALLGQIKFEEIRSEFVRQIETFEEVMGRSPDFIDGHHHIHQLPIIRDAIVSIFLERFSNKPIYLRNSSDSLEAIFKRKTCLLKCLIIGFYGSQLRKLAEKNNVQTNAGFSGIYDFNPNHDYSIIFKRFLIEAQDRMIIMCHPGGDDGFEIKDRINPARVAESNYLASDDFLTNLSESGFVLRRFFPAPKIDS